MSREIDRRDFSIDKLTAARETELHAIASDVSSRLPGCILINQTNNAWFGDSRI
ncbi:MAG: hypothetical protein OJF51_004166 [Nitrospira sp.]|jgi:hypothetical protein|nr:MAG: hypothetical protein OJF51_004166 [Nitrospira sp.]